MHVGINWMKIMSLYLLDMYGYGLGKENYDQKESCAYLKTSENLN